MRRDFTRTVTTGYEVGGPWVQRYRVHSGHTDAGSSPGQVTLTLIGGSIPRRQSQLGPL